MSSISSTNLLRNISYFWFVTSWARPSILSLKLLMEEIRIELGYSESAGSSFLHSDVTQQAALLQGKLWQPFLSPFYKFALSLAWFSFFFFYSTVYIILQDLYDAYSNFFWVILGFMLSSTICHNKPLKICIIRFTVVLLIWYNRCVLDYCFSPLVI